MDPQRVADFLVKEGFLLTALELHVELSEKRNQQLASLTSFFQDAKNFEAFTTKPVSSPMSSVCGSHMTLDDVSLFDLTRNSEDSHLNSVDDRVAVLEFELRKARETIYTLREELTQQTKTPRDQDDETDTIDAHDTSSDDLEDDHAAIKAHEQRIVNFLVNEYLLQYGYKLTSITFSDENNDADYFEDWDNIGINVTKPPNLLKLYRDFGKHFVETSKEVQDMEMQTDQDSLVADLEQKLIGETEKLEAIEDKCQELEGSICQSKGNNEQLNLQLKEKESLIQVLQSHEYVVEDQMSQIASVETFIEPELSSFLKLVMAKCYPCQMDDKSVDVSDDIINQLAASLPNIVPNILLNKREELLPLLLTAIQCHPNGQVRDQLLNLLFNLTKKPDGEQRKVILRGFQKIARAFGPDKVESELLPQLWEQLEHKYPERRLLVAETCAVLMPYIPEPLLASLVFSMLQQLVLEDKSVEVRRSAIASLGLLILHLKDDTKSDLVVEMMSTLLKDPSEQIISTVHDNLLPSVAKWLFDLQRLEKLSEERLNDLVQHCELLEDLDEAPNIQSSSLGTVVEDKIKTVHILLPFVISSVIRSSPVAKNGPEEQPANNIKLLSAILATNDVQRQLTDLKEIFQREWYESWSGLNWFKVEWLGQIVLAISKVPGVQGSKPIVDVFTNLIQDHVDYMGDAFTRQNICPRFNQYLPHVHNSPQSEPFSLQEVKRFESCLVPVYVQGVLAKLESPGEIADKLQNLAIMFCESEWRIWAITKAIEQTIYLNQDGGNRDAIAEMGWALVVHSSPKVKAMAGITLQHLACTPGNGDLLGPKIIPGLVTLSSDPDPGVRSSSMLGLAYVVISAKATAETREKAAFQLVSFLDIQHERNVAVKISAVESIGVIICKDNCPHKLRDELFLPKLAEFVIHMQ
jgi:hypothetical protein